MSQVKFGPVGLGGVKEAISNLKKYKELGLKACEIAFTYGVYIKKKEDATKIGAAARELGIQLSIHAPYWINLNSAEKEKIEKSKQRILKCCEVGTLLGAKKVVFHPGYYTKNSQANFGATKSKTVLKHRTGEDFVGGKIDKEKTYENIKREILEMQKEMKQKKYNPKLAPETIGKVNVFGSIDEIKQLVEDTMQFLY